MLRPILVPGDLHRSFPFRIFFENSKSQQMPTKKKKRKAKISSLIYSDIICMNLLWWTCWVNESHVVSLFILIWCDTTLIFWDEWMSGYTRNPENPKDLVSQESQDSSNFGALNHEFLEVGLIGRFNSMCCKNCTVSKRFSTFVKRPTSCIPPQLLEVFLSQPLSGIACKEIIFTTSFHHLKILEKPRVKNSHNRDITMRFRFIKPHGIDHQWPGRFFGPGQGWLQLILCRSAQLQDLMVFLCWLNQPIYKICASNWILSPKFWGWKLEKTFETTT